MCRSSRRCIKSIHRGLSRSVELIFNQDFEGLFIYIIILVLCGGDDGGLGQIIMTFSFMKNWKGGWEELKLSERRASTSALQRCKSPKDTTVLFM